MRLALIGYVLVAITATAHASPVAERGVLDLRGVTLDEPIALRGTWAMWADELRPPAEADPTAAPLALTTDAGGLEVTGCATLGLRILVDGEAPLAARIVGPTTAYAVHVGGRVVSRGGTPACKSDEADPRGLGGVVVLPPTAGVIDVIVHVSAYADAAPYAGAWTIGEPDEILAIDQQAQGQRWLQLGGFAGVALLFLGVFALRLQQPPLWFALACATAALGLAASNDVTAPPLTVVAAGLDHRALGPLELLGLLASTSFALLMVATAFPGEKNRVLVAIAGGLAAVVTGVGALQIGIALVPIVAVATAGVIAAQIGIAMFLLVRAAARGDAEAPLWLVTMVPLLGGALVWLAATLVTGGPPLASSVFVWFVLAIVVAHALVMVRGMVRGLGAAEAQARDAERSRDALRRFVPAKLLELVDSDATDVGLGEYAEREMAVLFADVRGFTAMTEELKPGEVLALVNEVLATVGPVIRKAGGFVDKYLGDGVIALLPGAQTAIDAAVAMRKALDDLNVKREAKKQRPVRLGIGIHIGKLLIGVVGEQHRVDGTVLGEAVNTAARLESLTKRLGVPILVSGAVAEAVGDEAPIRPLGAVRVKGKAGSVPVFEVFEGDAADVADAKRATRDELERGLVAWREARFKDAVAAFQHVADALPGDPAVRSYLDRARVEARSVPPPGWDGIENAVD